MWTLDDITLFYYCIICVVCVCLCDDISDWVGTDKPRPEQKEIFYGKFADINTLQFACDLINSPLLMMTSIVFVICILLN